MQFTNTFILFIYLLTFQVLSNSVADGLLFYKTYNISGLDNCEHTAMFCRKFNDCFDALNRKFSAEGLRVDGKDYQANRKIE